MPEPFLHTNGGYRQLRAYQVSEIIYDITYHFVHRFLEKGNRTKRRRKESSLYKDDVFGIKLQTSVL